MEGEALVMALERNDHLLPEGDKPKEIRDGKFNESRFGYGAKF